MYLSTKLWQYGHIERGKVFDKPLYGLLVQVQAVEVASLGEPPTLTREPSYHRASGHCCNG